MLSSGLTLRGKPTTGNNKLEIDVDNWILAIIFSFIGTHILRDWKWEHKRHIINYV